MNKRPIGVFDSGVGGLSILKELQKLLPNENFIFLADQLHIPYGEKSSEELITLTNRITNYFLTQDIKLMVVACNTATCYAISALREKYSIPIVGTVPAVKTAVQNTKTREVAVISTPATAKSSALKKLIEGHSQGVSVLNIGCKDLENKVEEGEIESREVKNLLKKYLKPIKDSKIDQLVLGCTHYPFLKDTIREFLGPEVEIVDSGRAIAKRTETLVEDLGIENTSKQVGETTYLTTGDKEKFAKTTGQLLKTKIKAKKIEI